MLIGCTKMPTVPTLRWVGPETATGNIKGVWGDGLDPKKVTFLILKGHITKLEMPLHVNCPLSTKRALSLKKSFNFTFFRFINDFLKLKMPFFIRKMPFQWVKKCLFF